MRLSNTTFEQYKRKDYIENHWYNEMGYDVLDMETLRQYVFLSGGELLVKLYFTIHGDFRSINKIYL